MYFFEYVSIVEIVDAGSAGGQCGFSLKYIYFNIFCRIVNLFVINLAVKNHGK
jgi:hypothetical protein